MDRNLKYDCVIDCGTGEMGKSIPVPTSVLNVAERNPNGTLGGRKEEALSI